MHSIAAAELEPRNCISHVTAARVLAMAALAFLIWILSLGLCESIIEIVANPENATVFAGESAYFRCIYAGTPSLPSWRIDGINYTPSTLPHGYYSTQDGLYLDKAMVDMNNTEHVCYFTIFSGGQFTDLESTVAYLSILVIRDFSKSSTHVVMITHTYSQTAVAKPTSPAVGTTSLTSPAASLTSCSTNKSAGSTLCPTETIPAYQNTNNLKLTTVLASCIAGVTIFLLVAIGITVFLWAQYRKGHKTEESFNMKQNTAYEQTHLYRVRIPMSPNEAYEISTNFLS